MGLFFSTKPSKKVFKTHKDIKKALYKIKSLTSSERKIIYKEIAQELDNGGVSAYEGKKKLNHIFYTMYQEGRISKTDYENLKKLWN